MAQKVTLFKAFATGNQSGDPNTYAAYPQDLDSNFSSMETSINQLVDEVGAARLADSILPRDVIERRDIDTVLSGGRFRHDDLQVTRAGNVVTISAGVAYIKGQRIQLNADAVSDFTGLANAAYRIPIDTSGNVLPPTNSVDSAFFDLVTVAWDGSLTDADITDNLFNGGRVLGVSDQGFVQSLFSPGAEISDEFDANFPHRLNPPIRKANADGTVGDSGFFTGPDAGDDRWFWVSQRASGQGAGATVLGAIAADEGQVLLLEQARVFAERTTNLAIPTGAGYTAVPFTAPVANAVGQATRREPESYLTNPFYAAASANMTIPAGGSFDGTYLLTAFLECDSNDETYFDARIIQTVGGAAVPARQMVATSGVTPNVLNLHGVYDFVAGDVIQLQVRHDGTLSQNLTFARLAMVLIGGGV